MYVFQSFLFSTNSDKPVQVSEVFTSRSDAGDWCYSMLKLASRGMSQQERENGCAFWTAVRDGKVEWTETVEDLDMRN